LEFSDNRSKIGLKIINFYLSFQAAWKYLRQLEGFDSPETDKNKFLLKIQNTQHEQHTLKTTFLGPLYN